MEVWPPTHLKIGNVLCRLDAHQMLGGAIERLSILKEGDWQIKCTQQIGLIGAALWGDQCGTHPSPIARGVNVARCGEFERQGRIE
jgi:hypothetical protein